MRALLYFASGLPAIPEYASGTGTSEVTAHQSLRLLLRHYIYNLCAGRACVLEQFVIGAQVRWWVWHC